MKKHTLTRYPALIFLGGLLWLPNGLAAIPVVENSETISSRVSPDGVNGANSTEGVQRDRTTDPFAAFPEVPSLPADATPQEELLFLVNQLTQEVQLLRGIVEEQRNEISKIKQIQRERYIDLDRRLTELYRKPSTGEDNPALATSTSGAGNSGGQSNDNQEITSYEQAVGLIRTRNYNEAVGALKRYIDVYPKGQYVPNAFYWLGQVYTVQEKPDYNQARVALKQVIDKYPNHPKVPDARYKLGVVYDQLGDREQSKQLLQSVIKNNPQSSAARLADTYLRGIQ